MSALYYLLIAAALPEVWPRPAPTRARAPTPAKAARLCACSRRPHPVASQRPRARSPARALQPRSAQDGQGLLARALQPRSMRARGARALQPRGARSK